VPEVAGADPEPDDGALPERCVPALRLGVLVRGVDREAVEREREAVLAARERDELV
jgi:hypothetical protein